MHLTSIWKKNTLNKAFLLMPVFILLIWDTQYLPEYELVNMFEKYIYANVILSSSATISIKNVLNKIMYAIHDTVW